MPRLKLPSLQIIARELVEVAARRRTYAIRAAFALLGLCVFMLGQQTVLRRIQWFQWNVYASRQGNAGIIGHGQELMQPLFNLVSVGIALLLPTTAAMCISREREQGTLVLLALTPVGPTRLVLQKFLSQTLFAGALAMLCMPLLTIGYAYGGVDRQALGTESAFLAVLVTQLAAIGLAAGCIVRSSIGAIIAANALAACLLLPFFICNAGELPSWCQLSPMALIIRPSTNVFMAVSPASPSARELAAPLAAALVLLGLARAMVARRLEPATSSLVGRVLRRVDAAYASIDARLFRRVRSRELPSERPVFWREANRSSFCNWRYLVRMLLPISGGLVFLLLAVGGMRSGGGGDAAILLVFLLGGLLIALVFAGVVSRERSDQTLDVLLSSGLTPAVILAEKTRALARLRWAVIACALPGLWAYNSMPWHPYGNLSGLLEPLGFGVDFPLAQLVEYALIYGIISWLAVLIGIAMGSYHRAVLVSLAAALALMVGVYILNDVMQEFDHGMVFSNDYPVTHDRLWLWTAFSPCDLLGEHLPGMFRELSRSDVLIAWLIDAAIWIALRQACLRLAGRLLASTRARPPEPASA